MFDQHAAQITFRARLFSFVALLFMTFSMAPLVGAPDTTPEKKNRTSEKKAQEKKEKEHFDKVITLGVKPGQMKYDMQEFSVPAGGNIKLVFDNSDGTLQHNVLILTPGDEDHAISLAQKAWSMPNPINNDYVPDSDEVLFATSLLSPGEKETITFQAPEKPGDHPYVCTMPGHAMSMNGMMHVEEAKASGEKSTSGSSSKKEAKASKKKEKKTSKESFDKVITLGVKPGQMKYDLQEFSVPAGGHIKLIFDNSDGTLQHNVLILTPGDEDHAISLAQKAWSMPNPINNDYVPDSDEVLFATSLLSPGEKETITFQAPEKPDDHPYVCTMPGHAMSMNGMMHVIEADGGEAGDTKAKTNDSSKEEKAKKKSKSSSDDEKKVSRKNE